MRKKIKDKRDKFWTGRESDDLKGHLSQTDKHFLLYGYFVVNTLTVVLVLLILGISNLWAAWQNAADMEKIMNAMKSYVGSATEDEYDRIARTIRNDFILSDYNEDVEQYIQYIPNSSEKCPTCRENCSAQVVLVSLNTGEWYVLDLFEQGEGPEDNLGSVQVAFGYDEISQARIRMLKSPGRKEGSIKIEQGKGIISIHKMKEQFCDECIKEILKTVEGQELEELVLLDTEKRVFYPLEDKSRVQIGDYILKIEWKDSVCEIKIKAANAVEGTTE